MLLLSMNNSILPLPPFHLGPDSNFTLHSDRDNFDLLNGVEIVQGIKFDMVVFNGIDEVEDRRFFGRVISSKVRRIAREFLEQKINPAHFFGANYNEVNPIVAEKYEAARRQGHFQYVVLIKRDWKKGEIVPLGARRMASPSPLGDDKSIVELSRTVCIHNYQQQVEIDKINIVSPIHYFLGDPFTFYHAYYLDTPYVQSEFKYTLEKVVGDINLFKVRVIRSEEDNNYVSPAEETRGD